MCRKLCNTFFHSEVSNKSDLVAFVFNCSRPSINQRVIKMVRERVVESETNIFKLKQIIFLTSMVNCLPLVICETISDLFPKLFWTLTNWHISVGELTLDVGEMTSYVGKLIRYPNLKWFFGVTYSYSWLLASLLGQCWRNHSTLKIVFL